MAPWRLWAIQETQECTWQVVLNNLESVGKNDAIDHFVDQELYTVDKVFDLLVDAPIDPDEVILAMKEVGDAMPSSLRETGEGGCAACESICARLRM